VTDKFHVSLLLAGTATGVCRPCENMGLVISGGKGEGEMGWKRVET